jgi:Putative MetA-pathway of phenol degradation
VGFQPISPVVTVRLAIGAALCLIALNDVEAQQATSVSQQDASAAVDNNGQDFARPETLFQLRYIYQTAPGSGSLPGTIRTVTTDSAVLRSDLKIDVAPQWTLALRGDLPFVAKNAITTDDPTGGNIYGLGDAFAQAALIDTLSPRWAAGAGVRMVAPTGTNDLTGGTWQALPVVGARYMLPEITEGSFFTGLVRYDVSFAKAVVSATNANNLQFAPTLNIDLPGRWFVTFYPDPDIRWNFGNPITGQTGRLFLPVDFLVGREITKSIVTSLEVGFPIIHDYPVYDFKMVTRLNIKF